eukprot:4836472-Amphidinium_carterae.1
MRDGTSKTGYANWMLASIVMVTTSSPPVVFYMEHNWSLRIQWRRMPRHELLQKIEVFSQRVRAIKRQRRS